MSDEKTEIQNRNLVFIGAPRAGKTCLMAAWYEYLVNLPKLEINNVFEEGVYDVPKSNMSGARSKKRASPLHPQKPGWFEQTV